MSVFSEADASKIINSYHVTFVPALPWVRGFKRRQESSPLPHYPLRFKALFLEGREICTWVCMLCGAGRTTLMKFDLFFHPSGDCTQVSSTFTCWATSLTQLLSFLRQVLTIRPMYIASHLLFCLCLPNDYRHMLSMLHAQPYLAHLPFFEK